MGSSTADVLLGSKYASAYTYIPYIDQSYRNYMHNECFRCKIDISYKRINKLAISELTLSGRGSLSYRNQSIYLQSKSIDWFLYDSGLRHERVKVLKSTFHISLIVCTLYDSFPVTLYGSNLTQNN